MDRVSLVELPDALAEPRSHPGSAAPFVMGIDGGATKTLAAVLDLEHRVLHVAHGGPSNQDAVGAKAAVQALLQAADQAIERAGISQEQLGAAVLAVAGLNTNAVAEHVRGARPDSWIVVNDVVGAWASATGGAPGVAAISGTGSNVFGVGRPDGAEGWVGRAWRAGGWGHLLGDEGSGYWLGVQSIKAALRDREASGPQTALTEAAVAFFEAPSIEAVASIVYSKPLTKGEIAAFATETSKLAAAGDAVACELFAHGARELGEQIAAVIRQTGLSEGSGEARSGDEGRFGEAGSGGGRSFPVGLIGSAFKAGEVFVEPLSRVIHEHAPGAEVARVEMAPVGGSLLLGMRACGRGDELGAGELAQLLESAAGS